MALGSCRGEDEAVARRMSHCTSHAMAPSTVPAAGPPVASARVRPIWEGELA